MNTGSLVIRKCQGLDELRACVALQKEVWGFTDVELVPLRMFVVAGKIGGQVIGAFEKGELVGFALALPGIRAQRAYQYSHMLAVRQQYRNTGLGRRLKLAQRDDAWDRWDGQLAQLLQRLRAAAEVEDLDAQVVVPVLLGARAQRGDGDRAAER